MKQKKIDDSARAVLDNIRQRRTLPFTRMKPDPIAEEDLALILEAANWAPTHKFTEPWRFFLFEKAGRAVLGQLLGRTYTQTAGALFNQNKFDKTVQRPELVPLTVAVIMRPSSKVILPEFEELLAVGCAAQNLLLAAHSLKIGCSWSTPNYLDHPNIKEFFGLDERDRCLGFIYMGYPQGEWPTSKRCPIEDKVTKIQG